MNKTIIFIKLFLIVLFLFAIKTYFYKETSPNSLNFYSKQIQGFKTPNISIWTLLTDYQGYADSAIKLLKSIKKNTKYNLSNFFIMEIQEKPLPVELKKKLIDSGWRVKTVNRIPPRNEAGTFPRFRDQFTKLELWNMDEYEANIYFDSDTFVIQNIDEFLNMYKNFQAKHKIGVTRDIRAGVWQTTFNMGVFIIRPNRTEFSNLIRLKNDENFKFETTMSEQGFLNEVYKNQWYEIGFENNANLAVYTQKPKYWSKRENDIRIIHFTMEKPWKCGKEYKNVCQLWENFLN